MYDRKIFGRKAMEWYLKINGNPEVGVAPSWMPKNTDDIVTMMHSIENHYGADRFEMIMATLGGITPRPRDVGLRANIEAILKGEYDWSEALNNPAKRGEWKKIYESDEIKIASRAAEIYRVIASGGLPPLGENGTYHGGQVLGILTAGGNMAAASALRAAMEANNG